MPPSSARLGWKVGKRLWRYKNIDVCWRLGQIPKKTYTGNCGQKIRKNVKKSSKTGQDEKTFISVFASLFTANTKALFLEWRLGTTFCLYIGYGEYCAHWHSQ